jgi:hypothetical protein
MNDTECSDLFSIFYSFTVRFPFIRLIASALEFALVCLLVLALAGCFARVWNLKVPASTVTYFFISSLSNLC